MVSNLEQRLCRLLLVVLAELPVGASVPVSGQSQDVLTALAYYVPMILGELYREWTLQGLDEILPVIARKSGEGELEIFGVSCLVCDQTLVPLHLRVQVAGFAEEISWLECRLGERGEAGMIRKPYRCLQEMTKRLRRLEGDIDGIDWEYRVTFGKRVRF